MRVAVGDVGFLQQRTLLVEDTQYTEVAFIRSAQASQFQCLQRRGLDKVTGTVDQHLLRADAIHIGYLIIVDTVHRRSVYRTGTGISRDVCTSDHRHHFRATINSSHKRMLNHKRRGFLLGQLTKGLTQ